MELCLDSEKNMCWKKTVGNLAFVAVAVLFVCLLICSFGPLEEKFMVVSPSVRMSVTNVSGNLLISFFLEFSTAIEV